MARKCSDWIETYLKYTDNTEPRLSYRTWTAISMIAAVLQRKCFVVWGSEMWFPNLYIVLVGPPAARKGTAIRIAMDMLDRVGIYLAANETSRQRLIERIQEHIASVDLPNRPGYMHCSITVISPEYAIFVHGADDKMIPTLCDWWDCHNKWSYEVVHRDDNYITNIWVNILAATTPRSMQTILPINTFGMGLISRTLFIYEDWKDRKPYPTLDKKLEDPLISDLEQMSYMAGQFKISAKKSERDFFEEYIKWYDSIDNRARDGSMLEDSTQRLPAHLFKLCMISSVSRSNDMVITIEDFDRARMWLEDAESRAKLAFQGVGEYSLSGTQARIIRTLAQEKAIKRSDLLRRFYTDISGIQLSEILGTLMETGICRIEHTHDVIEYIEESERSIDEQ